MVRMILLAEWAHQEFSHPVPGQATLVKYAKNGMIQPPPVKAGKYWRVDINARFTGVTTQLVIRKEDNPILKRILEDGETTKI